VADTTAHLDRGKRKRRQKRAARLGDGDPSFITPEEFRVGAPEGGRSWPRQRKRQVPEDHFGTLINYTVAASEADAFALAQPYVPRGRVDEATCAPAPLRPVDVARSPHEDMPRRRLEVHPAPFCHDRMLDQLALAAESS